MTLEGLATEGGAAGAPSDAEVIRRVLAGETALFELLMRRHDQRVYRAVRSILRDEAEAEDAMQQAWLQVYLHLDSFEGTAAFSTWLVRIAANEALQRIRKRAPLAAVADDPEEERMDPRAEDPEERAAAHEATRLVERAVDRLPAHYRTVFMLRDVEGLSTAETACSLVMARAATVAARSSTRTSSAVSIRWLQKAASRPWSSDPATIRTAAR